MNATTMNVGATLSITVIFSFVTLGLAANLPHAVDAGLTASGIPADVAAKVAALTSDWRPVRGLPRLQPAGHPAPARGPQPAPGGDARSGAEQRIPSQPHPGPTASGMEIAFAVSALCCVVATIVSWFRGAPVIARDSAVDTESG